MESNKQQKNLKMYVSSDANIENELYGPEIFEEKKLEFMYRKFKREFIYFVCLFSTPLITYEYIRLYLLKQERIISHLMKNSFFNLLIIGSIYSLGSIYINYTTKEEIAKLYELKFQSNLSEGSEEDVMGNIKEKKRIDLFGEKSRKHENFE